MTTPGPVDEVRQVLRVLRGAAGLTCVALLARRTDGTHVVAMVEPPGATPVEGTVCADLGAAAPGASGSGPLLLNPDRPRAVRVPGARSRVLAGAAVIPLPGGLLWAERATAPLGPGELDALVDATRLLEHVSAGRGRADAAASRVRALEDVVEGVRSVLEAHGEADCVTALADGAARLTGASGALVSLVRAGGTCEIAAAIGEAAALAGRSHQPGPGLVGLALRSGMAVPTSLRFHPRTMGSVLGSGADLAVAAGDPILVHPFGPPGAPTGAAVLIRGAFSGEKTIHGVRTLCDAAALLLGEFRLREQVSRDAMQDGLTGLYNRPAFLRHLNESVAFSRRHGGDLALLMIDADHFKRVNDTWGHLAGDVVLRFIADTVRKTLRESDVPGRYGGEEFVVSLPRTGRDGARIVAERIRALCGGSPVPVDGGTLTVTVSIGVAVLTPTMARTEDLIAVADEALYDAKHAGRNRVVVK